MGVDFAAMSTPTPILTDAAALRERIRTKALGAIQQALPLQMRNGTLEVSDLRVDAKHFSPVDQYNALMKDGTLQEAVKATLTFKDTSGKVVDTAKNFTLVHLPYLTERHTVIAGGNEYQVANQLRRKPGVYTARADNGELRAIFNTGRGANFNLGFEPDKGTFHLQHGTSNIPLYPVLRGLGVSHAEIAAHLGDGVAAENARHHGKDPEKATAKLYAKLEHPSVMDPRLPHEQKVQAIRKRWEIASLDPHVTESTLGKGYDRVTPEAILTAAKKVLDVHAGKRQVDDTDALTYKTFHAIDDFLAERIRLTARDWAPKARYALSTKSQIREALRPAPFSDSVRKWVTTSSLTAVPTGINPLELIDHAVKVTSLGEGGIPSERAIPLDARMIHNTHFGALDPIRTPESSHSGVDIRATLAAHRDDHGNLYTVARNVKTGKDDFLKAGDLAHYVVAFPGQAVKGQVDAFVNGQVEKVDASRVTHQISHTGHLYSPATSLLPLIHGMQGNRAIMASKMGTQALPLIERETPFVQVKSHLPGEVSYEALYGHMVAPRAPVSGKVVKIEDGWIHIRPDGAEKKAGAYAVSEKLADRPVVTRRKFGPFTFAIEIKKGERPFGKAFLHDYGYLPGYVGPDGDSLDFWVGDDADGALASVATEEKKGGAWRRADKKYIVGVPKAGIAAVLAQIEQKPDTRCVDRVDYASWDELKESIERYADEDEGAEKTASKDEGVVKVPYNQNFPFPSKTYLHHELSVKPGDVVKAGQRLGDSNYTRDGVLALGKNLLVAYMPYHGLNSNDAVVISEGCSKKLTSEHMYREVYQLPPGVELSKERHKFYYGTKYSLGQYAVLDEHGVVKKGATVHPKDLLVVGLVKTPIVGTDALLGRISKALAKPYQESTLVWDHGTVGEVVDVVRTGTQIAILVKTREQMQVGDKLAGRHGNKGVVAKIIPDHEMVQDAKGRPIDLLLTSAGVISRCYDKETEFLTDSGWKLGGAVTSTDRLMSFDPATHSVAWAAQRSEMFCQFYEGDLYCYESNTVSLAVTPGHTMYGRPANTHARRGKVWRVESVDRLYGHDWELPSLAPLSEPDPTATPFVLPPLPRGSVKNTADHSKPLTIAPELWAAFLGWFLSEGHVIIDAKRHSYLTFISQNTRANPDKVLRIEQLLQKLPFCFRYKASVQGFVISGKQLAVYMAQFGYAHEKYVPPWLFQQPRAVREIFLDALWLGDGAETRQPDGRVARTIGLTSEQLIDDVQRLLYLNGVNSVKHPIKVKATGRHRPMWRCGVHLRSAPERLTEKHNWFKQPYADLVYCPSVPTGFVVTRRRGKILIAGNTNPSQVIETSLGKVVEKTGKPILFDNNAPHNLERWASDLLKKHGVEDKEHVYDPLLKRKIIGPDGQGVLVGRQFIYKLFKSTDTNFAGHGVGPYDLNEQPLKTGGDDSAKGLGKMEFDALVAHNARNFLREAATIKGQKNDEFWKAVQLGTPLPQAKSPFAFRKFVGMLEGAGLKVDQRGSKFKLLPLTDRDVEARTRGAITKPETLIAKNLKPEPGGLFDPRLTGGPQGTLYAHIDLHEPIPHPVFKEPVRRLLGLTEKAFDAHLAEHGGTWFRDQLKAIDVPARIKELRARMVTAKGADLNDVVKQIKYLEALQKEGYKPHEAYVVSKVPVIPPVFRPIIPQPNDPSQLMVADANKLYAHVLDSTHTLKTTAVESDVGKHRQQVFNAVAALYGTEDVANEELRGQAVKGFLSNIAGVGTPKGGFFQRKLMRRTQDVSGRGTAVPDPTLNMDEVGIPEPMLWGMYDKLITARLIRQGYTAIEAKERVLKKDHVAREALLAETRERPVLINRAPTLHRWSIVAAKPVLVQGKTIRVNPFVEKGLNLDYDGNCFVGSTEVWLTIDVSALRLLSSTPEGAPPMKFGPSTQVLAIHPDGCLLSTRLDDIPYLPQTRRYDRNGAACYDLPSGMQIWSYDHTQNAPVRTPVTGITIEEKCPVARVRTAREFEVTASTNESLCVYDHDTQEVVACAPDKALKRLVPIAAKLRVYGSEHDFEYGWMIGSFISDGFLQSDDSFGYAKVSDIHRDRFARAVERYEGAPVKRNTFREIHDGTEGVRGASVKDHFYRAPRSARLFRTCYAEGAREGRASLYKQLPDLVRYSEDALLGVLAGLIDGDGTLSVTAAKKRPQALCNISTSSEHLMKGIQRLATLLGLRASVSYTDPQPGRLQSVRAYTINLGLSGLKRHAEKLFTDTSRVGKRADQAIELIKGDLFDKGDIVPVPRHLMKLCASSVGPCAEDPSLQQVVATIQSRLKKAPYVSRATAFKMASHLRRAGVAEPAWYRLIEAYDVLWDVVASVEPKEPTTVYDLVVPATKVFVVNDGLVVWDTLQVHAPITHGAIEEAKRLTLSQMLLADHTKNKILAFPQHEAIIGFTHAAKLAPSSKPVRRFKDADAAFAAYKRGEIALNDPVELG